MTNAVTVMYLSGVVVIKTWLLPSSSTLGTGPNHLSDTWETGYCMCSHQVCHPPTKYTKIHILYYKHLHRILLLKIL